MSRLLICIICCLLLSSCSQEEDEIRQESSIDRATKEVADKVVEQIKTPLEKAEAVREIEEQRREQLQKQAQ
ncbi:MAG: hypothetical protein KJO28_00935 [Desulfofustis sp.]|nr:hypothetical protein [Desulfofustis sp.]NNF47254.1 hypothetical protein [Desulfofustis sp.]NNK57386.1 hypothetical protein [Desulfofustis sp.]